ncbi:MAG: hypothetical protein A2020_01110 [Lentisphaerae bacterium GWF2_45_14]|nr:MAG: hypothetical protein A2020_01110 [Lentisphaerae bacterium GWF2_45_14]
MEKLVLKNCIAPDARTSSRMLALHPFVRQSGDGIRTPWHLGRRKLLDYLAVFINSGHGIFSIEDKEYDIGPGDLFWVPPDTFHEMRGVGARMHCLYIHFDLIYDSARSHWDAYIPGDSDLSEYRRLMHPPLNEPVINSWRGRLPLVRRKPEILDIFRTVAREHKRSPYHELKLSGMILELINEIDNALEAVSGPLSHHMEKMKRAAEYILLNYQDPNQEIRKMARNFGLSETHFRKLFKENFGVSPGRMLSDSRIRCARELLAYTDMSVSEIASASGYKNIYDFSRSFRKNSGCSPTQFRK